jgi:hypothetical protein
VLYLASVMFFVPLFLTADPLIAVSSWAVAHGLQYLVFLVFHAGSRTRMALVGLIPLGSLIVVAYIGYRREATERYGINASVVVI